MLLRIVDLVMYSSMAEFFLECLKAELERRREKNNSYSIRAFARDLELDCSSLSAVLRRKRKLPKKSIDLVLKKLSLSPEKEFYFRSSLESRHWDLEGLAKKVHFENQMNVILEEERHFRIIADWEHFAILSLAQTEDFVSTPEYVSQRLNIPLQSAQSAIKRLLDTGLLEIENADTKTLKPTQKNLTTTQEIESRALKESHHQALKKIDETIELIPLTERYLGSVTMAIAKEKLPDAKKLIREFQRKLCGFLESDSKKEVYLLGVQLVPLSKKVKTNLNDENKLRKKTGKQK